MREAALATTVAPMYKRRLVLLSSDLAFRTFLDHGIRLDPDGVPLGSCRLLAVTDSLAKE